MTASFPSEGAVYQIESEARLLADARKSRETSRLCRCTLHTPQECGNLAESVPSKPLCFFCFADIRDHGDEGHRQTLSRMRDARDAVTHCQDCGGTLVEVPVLAPVEGRLEHAGHRLQCAACGLVAS